MAAVEAAFAQLPRRGAGPGDMGAVAKVGQESGVSGGGVVRTSGGGARTSGAGPGDMGAVAKVGQGQGRG